MEAAECQTTDKEVEKNCKAISKIETLNHGRRELETISCTGIKKDRT